MQPFSDFMAAIKVKNIPGGLSERLKCFPELRRRSLNSEIICNLQKPVGLASEDPEQGRKEAEASLR
jgi:hypothetical protein